MKITIAATELSQALSRVSGAVAKATTLPILGNVLISAVDETLRFTATDLDKWIQHGVSECEVEAEGKITVPLRKLTQIASTFTGEVTLEASESHDLTVNSGHSRFRLSGLSADEFPDSEQSVFRNGEADLHVVPRSLFEGAIDRCLPHISRDETRYILTGVALFLTAGRASFVATCGRRLMKVERELPPEMAQLEATLIIPAPAAKEIQRLIDLGEETYTIGFTQESLHFESAETTIQTRLISGTFPNFNQVIPDVDNSRIAFPVPREELLGAIRRAALMAPSDTSSVRLDFTDHEVTISAKSPDAGDAKESLNIAFQGSHTVSLSHVFLSSILATATAEELTAHLFDETSPIVLIEEEAEALGVVMPMRTAA
ncbi:MAG: DNA polymerase III subunit beta [Verrucomicrobiota bacterium]